MIKMKTVVKTCWSHQFVFIYRRIRVNYYAIVSKHRAALYPGRNDKSRNTQTSSLWQFRRYLCCRRGRHVVIKSAMLIIGDNQKGLFPIWTGANNTYQIVNKFLAIAYIRGGFVTKTVWWKILKMRIDKSNRWKPAGQGKISKPIIRIVIANHVLRVERIPFKKPQLAWAVLKIFPRNA